MSKGTAMTIILIRVKTAVTLEPLTSRTNLNREKNARLSANQEAALLVTFF